MSDTPDVPIKEQELNNEQKKELKKLLEKDAKSGRKLSGFWNLVLAAMGCFMVIFYFFSAGVTPFATQYQRGIYVLLTYVMILVAFPKKVTSIDHSKYPKQVHYAVAAILILAAAFFAYQLFTTKNYVYLFFMYGTFVFFPQFTQSRTTRPTIVDLALVVLSLLAVGYFMTEFENFNYRSGAENDMDVFISVLGLILSLEVARRVLGWSMFIIGVLFLLYGLYGYGDNVPSLFAHRKFSLSRIGVSLFMEQGGVFGIMAGVLVTYVILFIFFGSFMQKSGVGRFFIEWPMALSGRSYGGPAKVSVIASAFFGSVSGSAIANTVSTGSFTIPLMKRTGFRPHVAGAIEPAASIGGMFMPPIMGAGGFLMAEFTNLPYRDIMILAVFPAALYFFSVLMMIHFEAKKFNIRGVVEEGAPTAMQVFLKGWYKIIPLAIIVVLMLVGYSPGMSAFWATLSCVVISWFDGQTRMLPDRWWMILAGFGAGIVAFLLTGPILAGILQGIADGIFSHIVALFPPDSAFFHFFNFPYQFLLTIASNKLLLSVFGGFLTMLGVMLLHPDDRRWFGHFWEAMVGGAKSTLVIGATVGVIGIIVGTISLTGIGSKMTYILSTLSQGILPLAILLVGLASLILGMGVPVTAAYLITAVLVVPFLSTMLVDIVPSHSASVVLAGQSIPISALIAAHMIVYWFSQDSNITPPVCVAAYAGAAIAGSDPWKTGWTSFKFAKFLYIGPFLFAYEPAFLLYGPWYETLLIWFSSTVGTVAFAALSIGFFLRKTSIFEWILLVVGAFLCYHLAWYTDIAGYIILAAVYFIQKMKNTKEGEAAPQPD